MKDGIIKGDGTSRLIKAPATIPATFAEFRAALIAGTLPVDLLFNAVGWDVIGTALNKANLLTDTVAEALGLKSEDPTVNEAINELLTAATQIKDGRMSAADKIKLDGVDTGANNYTHPTSSGSRHIPAGGATGQILQNTADGAGTWQDLEAVETKISEAVRTLYGLTADDANVEKALQKNMQGGLLSAVLTGFSKTLDTGAIVATDTLLKALSKLSNSFVIVTGSYTGDGTAGEDSKYREINIGLAPFLVFIEGGVRCIKYAKSSLFFGGDNSSYTENSGIQNWGLAANGFNVSMRDSARYGYNEYASNRSGVVYRYTALVKR